MKTAELLISSTILACGLIWPLAGCSPDSRPANTVRVVTGLAAAQATLEPEPDAVAAVGTVRAHESASLAAQTMGRVTAVLVHEGDTVRAGQVLVRMDGAASQAELDRARAGVAMSEHEVEAVQSQAALAASTLARYKLLRDEKSVSPQEFDEVDRRAEAAASQLKAARSQLEGARAAVNAAKATAGYAAIIAPFAGVVTGRHVDPGAMAVPGAALVDVDRAGALQLEVSVDESRVSAVKMGTPITVEIPSIAVGHVEGHVAQIVPAADAASHSFVVKIDLPVEKDLRAGMYGVATIVTGSHMTVMIPQSAVVAHGSLHSVWALGQSGVASLRYVALGAMRGNKVEVLSGINQGEQVVLEPGDRELGGVRVEVRP